MNEGNNIENAWYEKPAVPGYRQFLILIGLVGAGFLLTLIVSLVMIVAHYGVASFGIMDTKTMPAWLANGLMVAQDVCMFGVPAIAFAKIVSTQKDYFYLKGKSPVWLWLLVVLIAFSALPVSDLLGQITEWIPIPKNLTTYFKKMESAYNEEAIVLLNFKTFGSFIVSVFMIALLPAVFEELIFRGALQQALLKWTGRALPAIIISSIIFSAIHMSYYGFLPRAMLGVVLGLVYYYGKNIWLNMLIHFINNATVVVALYVASGNKPLTASILDENSSYSPWYLQLIGVAALIAALMLFIRKSKLITHNS
ncbi:MAG TPA: CPBP family intramembrane glutamic endopeptidase [Arachidicoccus sp.]